MKTRFGGTRMGVTSDHTKVVLSKNHRTETTEDQPVAQSTIPAQDITATNDAEEPIGKVCGVSMLYRTQLHSTAVLNILFYV